MAYFKELPNLEVLSRLPDKTSNQDYITIKNLWRRAKLREDIANAITAFQYYQIEGNERPDQIAEKVYGDPELDWVILITNNITNLNNDWPLDNESLYNYLIEKYGSEEALQEVHHIETVEQRDKSNRLVIPGELQVDEEYNIEVNTILSENQFRLTAFPSRDDTTVPSVDLIQILNIFSRDNTDAPFPITDIQIETSNLKVYTRDFGNIDIKITNDLKDTWPSGWGGDLKVYTRSSVENITIEDALSDIRIPIPERLYEVVGVLIDGKIVPVFQFRYTQEGD